MGEHGISVAAKTEALIESLPWLTRLRGTVLVVKFGGANLIGRSCEKA